MRIRLVMNHQQLPVFYMEIQDNLYGESNSPSDVILSFLPYTKLISSPFYP